MTLVSTLKLIGVAVLACLFFVCVLVGLKTWTLNRHEKGKAVPKTLRSLFVEPSVTINESFLIYDTSKDFEKIDVRNLKRIEYHYHAVVGFVSMWEFIDKDGKSINIDGKTRGLQLVLNQLERTLPGFSLKEWRSMFDDGDVEDSFVVWRAV